MLRSLIPCAAASWIAFQSRKSRWTFWLSKLWPQWPREEWTEDELFEMVRRAYPYRNLERKDFDDVLRMLAEGFSTKRGRRSAYLHHDAVNQRLRGRRGARLAAITSGGAIPDTADYAVVLEPSGLVIGSVTRRLRD